jgi:hypothetical protein
MLGARDIWRGYATRYVGLFGDGTSMFMYLPLGSGATRFTGLARPALNTTFHWSLCSSVGNVYCSINGTVVSVSRPADWLTYTVDEGDKIVLGCKDSYGNGWASPGWTDNIRITFGSALYTSNFAPPSGNTY